VTLGDLLEFDNINFMPGGRLLVLDLLSVHLIRNINGSTIISYHPSLPQPTTTAEDLHRRILLAGKSFFYQYYTAR